jgi:hypothetical protein
LRDDGVQAGGDVAFFVQRRKTDGHRGARRNLVGWRWRLVRWRWRLVRWRGR